LDILAKEPGSAVHGYQDIVDIDLDRRNLKYVRYADGFSIYTR
jgi:hypothetical protein